MGDLVVTYTAKTLQTCHQLCQEDYECQSFLLEDAAGAGGLCTLVYEGVCTKSDKLNG
jgi:hypothetical protein